MNVAPNYVFDDTFTLTWEWPFETGENDTTKAANNKLDTILGNLAADPEYYKNGENNQYTNTGENANYSTDINYSITVTVEQVD